MSLSNSLHGYRGLGGSLLFWIGLVTPIAAVIGSACAFFLWSLERAAHTRLAFPSLLFFLPFAGVVIVWLYARFGGTSDGGTNLLFDAIHAHESKAPPILVPRRMAPLILLTTLITHLFGGSAGREGTAVQMGGSIASGFGRWFALDDSKMRLLLMAGIAAGFGGVFGTPVTGAIFAMEVLALGRLRTDALFPCLLGAIVGDWACGAWAVPHTSYTIAIKHLPVVGSAAQGLLLAKVVLAALVFGLVSRAFSEISHAIQAAFKRLIAWPLLRPVIGAFCVIFLTYLIGTRDYLGLGVSSPDPKAITILSCFSPDGATAWSWWWKLLLTAITLGSGFKGGEVTPLFFIGAALGNVLGRLLDAPVDLFAGLGFLAVFAGATNTPIACTIMGIELFGSSYAMYFALACFLSYLVSGPSGIYASQRVAFPKEGLMQQTDTGASLRDLRNPPSS